MNFSCVCEKAAISSTTTVAFIWGKNLMYNVDIDWSMVFKHNLAHIRENKMREFNLKFLYNLLPVKTNLFRWGISNDDVCPTCNIIRHIMHLLNAN